MYADRLTSPFWRCLREHEREKRKSLAVINKVVNAREEEKEKEWYEYMCKNARDTGRDTGNVFLQKLEKNVQRRKKYERNFNCEILLLNQFNRNFILHFTNIIVLASYTESTFFHRKQVVLSLSPINPREGL